MKKKTKILAYACLTWFCLHSLFVVVDGLNDEISESDLLVILGNKVNEDGSLSPRLESRMAKGLELYQKGLCKKILVSGGLGKEGHLEGDVMAAYLLDHAVPQSAIIIDNEGVNTQATVENLVPTTAKTMSILVVSQYYHITRCKLAFSKRGFTKVQGVHAEYFELRDFYAIFREFFGYYKYLLFI